jgi:hypothetical protein
VDQANLLLQQILDTPKTRFILCPNQHLGSWQVGFMSQWIAREYLARRGGAQFTEEQVLPARCPLLGYAMKSIMVEGQTIGPWFFRVETQPEVGETAYDRGAEILYDFFRAQLRTFLDNDILPLGREIIECCLSGGEVADYEALVPGDTVLAAD